MIHDANDSELIWDGERCIPAIENGIDTYEDHRMALSFAPSSLCMDGIKINNPNVVTKSYPHFWEDMGNAGFGIESITCEE